MAGGIASHSWIRCHYVTTKEQQEESLLLFYAPNYVMENPSENWPAVRSPVGRTGSEAYSRARTGMRLRHSCFKSSSLPRYQLLAFLFLFPSLALSMARSGISPASIASSPTLYDQVFGLSVDLTSAQVFESGDFDDSTTSKSSAELEVEVTRSVRCVDEDRRRSWTHGPFTFDLSSRRWRRASALTAVPKESPTENAFLSRSPSGRKALRAVKVKASPEASKADPCLEVWIDGSLVVRSSQSSALHEGIFKSSAGQPGGLCWSQDE